MLLDTATKEYQSGLLRALTGHPGKPVGLFIAGSVPVKPSRPLGRNKAELQSGPPGAGGKAPLPKSKAIGNRTVAVRSNNRFFMELLLKADADNCFYTTKNVQFKYMLLPHHVEFWTCSRTSSAAVHFDRLVFGSWYSALPIAILMAKGNILRQNSTFQQPRLLTNLIPPSQFPNFLISVQLSTTRLIPCTTSSQASSWLA